MKTHRYVVLFTNFTWDATFSSSVEEAIKVMNQVWPDKKIDSIFKNGLKMVQHEKIELVWKDD